MRHTRHSLRGFTLVELMVSLLAGLIVTIAVVGLARAATTTFFEAARISTVESTVRNASERLRQDLARASYMSTGNIRLARDQAPGVPMAHRIAVSDPTSDTTGSRYNALKDLSGIRIIVGGSATGAIAGSGAEGPNLLSSNNGLTPDAIILGGNYTTDDSYQGTLATAVSNCGGHTIALNSAGDAAVRRIMAGATPIAGVLAAFAPVAGSSYAARVVDGRGCQHYAVLCSTVPVAIVGTVATLHFAQSTSSGPAVIPPLANNCGADPTEPVTVSPVQRVRWYIGPNTDAALDPAPGVEVAGNKFNLYRDFLDAADPPLPIPASRQIVAEYAVDLKFGITVADFTNALQVFDMDDPAAITNIGLWTQAAGGTMSGSPSPHRVRSVRFRVVTRAAVPDRQQSLSLPSDGPYLTRYCVENQVPASCKSFARVRTIVSEVALMNQLGMTY